MNSLQELNNYGSSSLTVTDSRFAGIKYTPAPPASPFTQILNITGTNVSVNAGIDITEIINYSTANVRYRVTIVPGAVNPLTGSSISWASLPSGVTLSTVGNVYTLSGIDSVAQWQAVKSFTWTLPGNYATKPFWYLQVSVLYYDEELGVERTVDWEAYDEDFYYVAELNASSSLTCDALDVILGSASITSAFTPTLNFIRVKRFQSNLSCPTSLTAEGQINADNLYAVTSMPTARLNYNPGNIKGNLTSTSSIVCNGVIAVSNMVDRSYTANNENSIFATDTPQIEDATPSGATFTITLSSSLGRFSDSSTTFPSSPWSYSGTLEQINAKFSSIKFYPNDGVSSNGSFTYTQQKNAVTLLTRTINLTGIASTYLGNTYSFTSNTIWTPPNADLIYGSAEVVLIGGGSGGSYCSGGNAGQFVTATPTLTSQSYSIQIGTGGAAASTVSANGSAGTSTTAFALTATGGATSAGQGQSFDGVGSGGGLLGSYTPITDLYYAGGGGKGANANTGSPTLFGGGIGGGRTRTSRTAKTLVYSNINATNEFTKFGSGIVFSSNSNPSLTIASHSDFNFSSTNFTIDCWIKRQNNSKEYLFEFIPSSGTTIQPQMYFDNVSGQNKLIFKFSTLTISADISFDTNYNHVMIVRETGNQFKLYYNRQLVGSGSLGSNPTSVNCSLQFGKDKDNNFTLSGYFTNFRVSRSVVYSVAELTREIPNLNISTTVLLIDALDGIRDNTYATQPEAGAGNGVAYVDNPLDDATSWNGRQNVSTTNSNTGSGGGGGFILDGTARGVGTNGSDGLVLVRFV